MCRVRLTPVTAQLLHEAFPLLAADATCRNDAAHHCEDISRKPWIKSRRWRPISILNVTISSVRFRMQVRAMSGDVTREAIRISEVNERSDPTGFPLLRPLLTRLPEGFVAREIRRRIP